MRQCWAVGRPARQQLKARGAFSPIKRYSQAVRSQERVAVPCRSNGEISLDIHHPLTTSAQHDSTPKILIYLPRGPLLSNDEQQASTISQLSQHLSGHHIVRINYRLSPQHQYPAPVHDTLTGYDWILRNILTKRAISRPGRADCVGRLAVCGELLGGGLASMLALTECRVGEPGLIAAAVNNPLVDWASLAQASAVARQQESGSATEKLLELRRTLFSKPDRYFDSFASPMLLFRTAGIDVPPAPAEVALDDMAQLSLHEREDYAKPHGYDNANEDETNKNGEQSSVKTAKKSSRRYPSTTLNLHLPALHISSGPISPFSAQAEEFAHVLRQSYIRQARQATAGSSFGRKMLLDDEEDEFEDENEERLKVKQTAEAEEKAQLLVHRDLGLWDGSISGQDRVRQVAMWLRARTAR